MPEMRARITADPSGMRSGFAQAGAFADRAGKQIANRLNSAFGVGALFGVIAMRTRQAFAAPLEFARELQQSAKGLNVTAEEYQMIAAGAEEAGVSISEFLRQLQEHPSGVDGAIQSLERFRGAVKVTNEEIQNLTESSYWKEWKEWGVKKYSAAKDNIVNAIAGLMLFGSMSKSEAAAGLAQDTEAQRLNAMYERGVMSPGLINAITPTAAKKGGAGAVARASFWTPSITGRQAIGAQIGTEAIQIVSEQRKTNEKLESIDRKVGALQDTVWGWGTQ